MAKSQEKAPAKKLEKAPAKAQNDVVSPKSKSKIIKQSNGKRKAEVENQADEEIEQLIVKAREKIQKKVSKNKTKIEHEEIDDKNQKKNSKSKSVIEEEEIEEKSHKRKNLKEEVDEDEVEEKESSLYTFPMNRVSRIIKSDDPNVRITQEAVFVVNKASELFLNLLSTEAYACAFLDRKKTVGYNYLSSIVTKRKRLDFLSDFVPEKVKAEDALKEYPCAEM